MTQKSGVICLAALKVGREDRLSFIFVLKHNLREQFGIKKIFFVSRVHNHFVELFYSTISILHCFNTHIHELLDDKSSSSSPTQGTTKISYVVLLSAPRTGKTKNVIKNVHFDHRYGDDFIIKWLISLVEVVGEVSKDNM
jgi:hypothetical protein